MTRSRLRPATVPHTNKLPGECPHCGSHAITRKGVREKKLEIVQLWRCASCKRTFTPGPAALRNKTYPVRTVLECCRQPLLARMEQRGAFCHLLFEFAALRVLDLPHAA